MAIATTSSSDVSELRIALAIRRPVNTAITSDASWKMPVPSDMRIQAVNAQPEITNGEVLSGCRTDSGAAEPVERLARDPVPQFGPMVVGDQCDGFVAQPGAGFDQPPAEVDVFSGLQGLVESADARMAELRQMIAALGT